MLWKIPVSYGQSSPVIAGGRVYLTASEDGRLLTICLDARTGRELWRRETKREHSHKLFRANDPASPTPAADVSGVYTFFPDFGLAAYTPEGKLRWTHPVGPFQNFYGMASSPILTGDLLVLVCDQQAGSFVTAIDRDSGRVRWKTERPGMTIGWATPMIFHPGKGPAELIVLGTNRIDSYFLSTGERNWWTPIGSLGALGVPSATGDTLLVATAGTNGPWMPTFDSVLAKYDKNKDGKLAREEFQANPELGEDFGWIDADSDGIVTAEEWNTARQLGMGPYGAVAIRPADARGQLPEGAIRWRYQKGLAMIPAPVVYQDVYYMVRDGGIITALNPGTGELLKQGRTLTAPGEYYASPVAADGKIYLASSEGKITVLKGGADWQILSVNDMGDEVHATPALSDARIYVRTRSSLYCFGSAQ